jgi:hypothetical protein
MTINLNVPRDERFSIHRSLCPQYPDSFATLVVDLSGGSDVYAVNIITTERDDYYSCDTNCSNGLCRRCGRCMGLLRTAA